MKRAGTEIIIIVMISFIAICAYAGELEPPAGAPAPTMHTLEDIYNKIDSIAVLEKSFPAKSGQALCYDSSGTAISCSGTGQDGEYQKGIPYPDPRFIDNGDGTVTDNLTDLIWLKNANCFGPGSVSWSEALS